jgi:large subunit ribosomal protein L25
MDVITLKLNPRTVTGKKVKTLRRQGTVPVHIYGTKEPPVALQAEHLVLERILPRIGTNIPLSVETEDQGSGSLCFVREVQRHPVTEQILHVDFMRVDVSQTIRSEVPINLQGNAPAVRDMGGTVLQPLQSVLVESLPMNVPASFELDVSGLDDFEKSLYVRDIAVSANVTVITDLDELIARVAPPRIEVEEVVEEAVEGEELEEGAEEGAAPAAEGETPTQESSA